MLKSYFSKNQVEAGCDEAGRGCLAGPVVAAAVILPKKYKNKILNDSKTLSQKQREILKIEIEKDAIAYAIGVVNQQTIDEINILNASILAMHQALDQLSQPFEFIIIDGNRFKQYRNIPHQCIVKGDAKYLSIAAASVLAKTYRDAYMEDLHSVLPQYHWNQNMGYPTKKHRESIQEYGVTEHHRLSFQLLARELEE